MKKYLILYFLVVITYSFSLAQIPNENLIGWYMADSVIVDGGYVSQLNDFSGNDFHIVQNNAVNRPLWQASAINGHHVLSFDGTNDYMVVEFGQSFSQPNTVFIVYKVLESGIGYVYGSTDATSRTGHWYDGTNIAIRSTNNLLFSKTSPFSNFILGTHIYNSVNSSIFENGDLKISGNVGTFGSTGLILGNQFGYAPVYSSQCDIAEIIFYNTLLVDAERQQVEEYLMDKYASTLELGADILINYGLCDTLLSIDSTFNNILWSTGATNDTIFVNQSSQYFVQATDIFGRVKYDTINVQFPSTNISNSLICLGDSVLYAPDLIGSYAYLWSDLTTDASKYYKNEGDYWLRIVDDFGCFDTAFFSVDVDSFKNEIWLGNDTALCAGNSISLISGEDLCSSFLWTPGGNTSEVQVVNETGWQKIMVENGNGCTAKDSIYVTIVGTAPTPDYIVENLCFGETTQFIDNSTPQADIASWKWILNENDTLYVQNAEWVFENIGTQNIELIVEAFSGCSNSLNFQIEILPIPEVSFSHYPACAGTNLNFTPIVVTPSGTIITDYLWSIDGVEIFDDEDFSYTYISQGVFSTELFITINNGCTNSYRDSVIVLNGYSSPEFFSLVSPSNNSIITGNVITFQWNFSDNAILYQLLVSNDLEFSNLIFESDLINTNVYALDIQNLADTLFWKVLAFNPCLQFEESETRQLFLFDAFGNILNNNSVLWLVADSVNIVSGKVLQWYDKSNNHNEIMQTLEPNRPTLGFDHYSNQPFVEFNGTSSYFDGGNIININYKSHTFFIIGSNVSANGTYIAKANASGGQNRYYIANVGGNNTFGYSDNSSRDISIASDNTNISLLTAISDRSSSENYFKINNGVSNTNIINSNHNHNSSYNFLIGAYNSTSGSIPPYGWYLDGTISEIIIFDTILSPNTSQQVERYLHDKYFPPVNLGYDIRVPYGFCDTAIATAYKPWFTSYAWSTGETDSIIHVNRPGVYSVTVSDIFGFESSDDIRVFYPEVNNFADTIVCHGGSVVWGADILGDYSFEWHGSELTDNFINISIPGEYSLIVTDTMGCKYYSDTISFIFDNYEFSASIGPVDTSLCVGNRLSLVSNLAETVAYLWSTGVTMPEIVLNESGTYSVTTTNWRGCQANDEINVTITGTVPIPDFSSLGHCAKNTVSFSDLSSSVDGTINSWLWEVNGQEFSELQNTEIILEEPGIYNIRLSINTDANCGDYINKNIEIFPLPEPKFSPDYYCRWAEINFEAISTIDYGNVENNYWQINDFEFFADSLSFIFENSGTNTVKLISESNQACKDSIIKEIFVKDSGKPEFLTENTCEMEDLYFINTTEILPHNMPLSWSWDFGDDNISSESHPSHIYENPGIYDVNLSVVWQNMCENSINKQIEVYQNPKVEIINQTQCLNSEFQISADIESASADISEYIWDFGGKTYISSQAISPMFFCDSIGEYPLSLRVRSEFGCEAFVQDTIIVNPLPSVDFSVSRDWGGFPFKVDFTNLSQDASEYIWSFGDMQSSTEENPQHIFSEEGEFLVNLIGISENGCQSSASKKIISVKPIMDLILYDLRCKLNENYLETMVYIINNGTLPVSEPELILNLGDGKVYRESLSSIMPGEVIDYKLKTQIWRADKTLPEIICLEIISNPYETHYENKTEDNLICSSNVKNLLVFQAYPNPTNQSITVEYVLAKESDCQVSVINSMGELIYKTNFEKQKSHNKFSLDVSNLPTGIYFLQVRTKDEVETRKFVVQN